MNEIKNILICGLGAIGSIYAEKISEFDNTNLKILVDENRLKKYSNNPIIYNNKTLNLTYTLPHTTSYKADLILISTKADGLMWACENIRNFIHEEKAKGSAMVKSYEFEKHRRLAFPFATIILTIVGLCVSSRKSRQGMGLHLLVGLIITFSFIMLMQITQMFAIYGGFSPFWAAWTPNIIYSLLCVILVAYTPK